MIYIIQTKTLKSPTLPWVSVEVEEVGKFQGFLQSCSRAALPWKRNNPSRGSRMLRTMKTRIVVNQIPWLLFNIQWFVFSTFSYGVLDPTPRLHVVILLSSMLPSKHLDFISCHYNKQPSPFWQLYYVIYILTRSSKGRPGKVSLHQIIRNNPTLVIIIPNVP